MGSKNAVVSADANDYAGKAPGPIPALASVSAPGVVFAWWCENATNAISHADATL